MDKAEKFVTELLQVGFGTGAMEKFFWRQPHKYVQMHELLSTSSLYEHDAAFNQIASLAPTMQIVESTTRRKAWHGLLLDHVEPLHRLHVVASVSIGSRLTQEVFNFLTAADIPDREMRIYRNQEHQVPLPQKPTNLVEFDGLMKQFFVIDEAARKLAESFARQVNDPRLEVGGLWGSSPAGPS